ncbi:TnsD family transposase [Clostridium sp. OS1-26]|uniref:TnsD family transposase n=1 Tax=Clostridium sp. OS1-26 TaxID=3070681 RepID=UPI0027E025C1|nr:TnsD family transposase [Clostridium sp. OS1-26]WML36201.1 TnsD family transposase [Clostridium sp. OS1-26]
MIHFFTDPYKDELIYSAIARYHYYTGNADCKDTLEELFGSRSIIPSLEIGSNLGRLAENLGEKYTSEYIMKNHTVFPFYSPFLPNDRKKEIIKEIKYKDGKGLYTKLGVIAGSICRKNGIYYCPDCANNEIEDYGEVYIHREHQLQGVYVCPHHGMKLKKYRVDRSNSSRIEFIRLNEKLLDLRNIRLINKTYEDKLLKISKDAYYLLQADLDNVSKEKILEKYKNLLYKRGLTTSSMRVKQIELHEEFIAFYGKEFLKIMESSIDNDDEYNWLRVITRDLSRTVHPIRHLLLINFLMGKIEGFFEDINKKFNPFGEGPWPCLNRIANHYRMNGVKDLKITEDYKTRLPVGTFSCDCGFVYSRKGPDKDETDKYKIGRIKNFGKVWEDGLKVYLKEEKYGLRELARLMHCDPKTIWKFDALLGINYFNRYKNAVDLEHKEQIRQSDLLEKYKEGILKSIEENPTITRTKLREICKKEYIYLYRWDKKWLHDNLPNKTKSINHNKKVAWNERDKEIIALLKSKYKEFLSRDIPMRITKSRIGKSLGILADLEKNLNKLPETEKYLKDITETVEEFQIRRCKNIIDNKLQKDEDIKLWEIQRLAGIRTKDFKKVKEKIVNYINVENNRGMYEKGSS